MAKTATKMSGPSPRNVSSLHITRRWMTAANEMLQNTGRNVMVIGTCGMLAAAMTTDPVKTTINVPPGTSGT